MGVLRDSGKTNVTLSALPHGPELRDELLESVRETAGGDFEVFGEIGRGADDAIAYLARDLANKRLVALRLERSPGRANEYTLEVARRLDASIPTTPGSGCPRCGTPPRSWGRFCTQCGLDLWSGPVVGRGGSKDELLTAVKQATRDKFEILGEMSRTDGAGVVYFARDLGTGKIEALRLLEETEGYSIGMTSVLRRLVTDPDKPPGGPA